MNRMAEGGEQAVRTKLLSSSSCQKKNIKARITVSSTDENDNLKKKNPNNSETMLVPGNIPFSPGSFNRGDSTTVLDLLPAACQAQEDLFTRTGTCTIYNLKGA